MTDIGRWLVIIGLFLAAAGTLLVLLGRIGFRGLPGDIAYRGENVRFFFPIVTCLVASVILTLGMWLWRWLADRP